MTNETQKALERIRISFINMLEDGDRADKNQAVDVYNDACFEVVSQALQSQAEKDRVMKAAQALIDDIKRRYPNEELRCPLMIELGKSLSEYTKLGGARDDQQ